ncbi:F-box protein fbw2 [Phtheirospermum japonicum]|uniref:F-box protein fbw2 n=1 Tax=Phtheirospermum japonicum TaxID=374723 RepID=A0A830BKQ4_9LAMI|nr:F-box protein fbw2 [Phtheirospermum japonicum]
MLQSLISRSGGSPRKLSATGLTGDQSIVFIANHAQSLQTLRIPRSEINDPIIETVAEKLSALTTLDLSYCLDIGARSLEAIGRNCKSLTTLRRVMHPLEVIQLQIQDDEAHAIASMMPKLEHLEIAYLLVTTSSVVEIVKQCKRLELLDIRGCWGVEMDEKFLEGYPRLKVVGPAVTDCYEPTGWDDCSGLFRVVGVFGVGLCGRWTWMIMMLMWRIFWEDENQIEDDVEMWFYDDVDAVDAGFDWPAVSLRCGWLF